MPRCAECEQYFSGKLHYDPRRPPLETYPCLCLDCVEGALNEVIDELETELEEYRAELEKLEERR